MKRLLGPLVAVVCIGITPLSSHAQDGDADDSSARDSVESDFEALEREVTAEEQPESEDEDDQEDDPVTPGRPNEEKETGGQTGGEGEDTTDADDTDAELAEIEAALADDEGDGEQSSGSGGAVQSLNPEISLILDTTAAWFSSDNPDLRGGHDPSNIGFNLQGLELAVGAAVDPYFRFDSSILFSLFGVEIEEAYITTLSLPWKLQVRAGQFKTKVGRLNPTHVHSWKFVTQPLVNAKFFGGESLRGLGLEVSRLLPTPWFSEVLVSAQNVAGDATGRSFIPAPDAIESPLDLTLNTRLEQFFEFSSNTSLMWGLGWVVGRNKSGRGNVSEIYETDLFLKWRDATRGGRQEVGWQTEVMLRRRQVPLDVLQDWGGYTHVYYSPSKYWEFGTRYEYVAGIAIDDSGETAAGDPLDPAWTEPRQRGAINASWMPSHFSRLRLEYQLDYLPYRDAAGVDSLVHQTFLQLEVVAGAHGTHDY
ncbi:MAG: zinc-regulated TonB-dependent outer membrane receptor [Myxococcota bacterium]